MLLTRETEHNHARNLTSLIDEFACADLPNAYCQNRAEKARQASIKFTLKRMKIPACEY
jgi:hypothetical protein